METIKIISNPYKREICFKKYDSMTDCWSDIKKNNPNSKLLGEDVVKGFFPYRVEQIVKQLSEDYIAGDDTLKIVFEGTEDEYHELTEECKGYAHVETERSDYIIENARDVLPKIIDIFSKIKPIVDNTILSEEKREIINRDIEKFTDASNDIIPICVLGNYSSGKSTFINALIGQEILPSGDMPITAKIYKVAQSRDEKKAAVSFKIGNDPIRVLVTDNDYIIESESKESLVELISNELEQCKRDSISAKVSRCLEGINGQREGGTDVSDLIDISVPFISGPLRESKHTFVIFDTPGSNTATYREHFDILEEAMKNLSNGIPLYVAEYNSLDSCDNEKLYESIKSISQIDARFTMIVVNKADVANIKENHLDEGTVESIREQAVPRNLYSGGIYFISSIMGLGSKNDGKFADDHAAEFFEDNEKKYSDPESKKYKQLYKYNIMPEQIKKSICDISEKEDNKIFANSGLLAIEHEIVNFADKYSAYDKCNQSNNYIGGIIEATQNEIDAIKSSRKEYMHQLESDFEEKKNELIQSVDEKSTSLFDVYLKKYDERLSGNKMQEVFEFYLEDMQLMEAYIQGKQKEAHHYSNHYDDLWESLSAVRENILQIGEKNIGSIAKDIGDDLKGAWDSLWELQNAKSEADKDTANALIKFVTDDFNNRLESAAGRMDNSSREYWDENAKDIKKELSQTVAKSNSMDEKKKKELKDLILSYPDLSFHSEHVFHRNDFEAKVAFFFALNRIELKKLVDSYNQDYREAVDAVYERLKDSHKESFNDWLQKLVEKIKSNIVDYSPTLSEQAHKLEEENRKIRDLEKTKQILQDYKKQIVALIDWKPAG